MPFESLGQLSDVDAQALDLYLNTPANSVKQGMNGSTPATGFQRSASAAPSLPGRLINPLVWPVRAGATGQ